MESRDGRTGCEDTAGKARQIRRSLDRMVHRTMGIDPEKIRGGKRMNRKKEEKDA